jgi:DeoR/GlpR family transcriptional regulator of sugar metabolism
MLSEDRRRLLLEKVKAKGSLSVAEAEKTLDVSRMTVHRDLDLLAAQGFVRKVHGGVVAVAAGDDDIFDPRARPFEDRMAINRDAKRAIARHVAKLVDGARTLVLDASSTVYFMADALANGDDGRDLFIVTGGLPLFSELVRRGGGIRAALHGGEPHARTGSLVGPLALASLREMRFDFAIMSALGAEEGAVYVSNPEEVELKRLYMQRARRKILAIDATKVGQAGAYHLGPLGEFDQVVTEKGATPPAQLARKPKAVRR